MKIEVCNIALLLSICTTAYIHTSDSTSQQYPFSDYDKNVFTNHVTNKVELIYSTPFIESISNEPMTIASWELKLLLYPALTRIVYKQRQLLMRLEVGCQWPSFVQIPQEKDAEESYWKKEAEYRTQLDQVEEKIQGLEQYLHTPSTHVNIPTRELMRVVQYAAQKIKQHPLDLCITVSAGDDSQLFAARSSLEQLLRKYRIYEQQ